MFKKIFNSFSRRRYLVFGISAGIGIGLTNKIFCESDKTNSKFVLNRPYLSATPTTEKKFDTIVQFTYTDLAEHNSKEKGIWVSYKDNVYDITDFIANHPGGVDKIMLAAGKAIDPYWKLYSQHLKPEIVDDILSKMKIGTLIDYDENKYKNVEDPYAKDPVRDPDLIYHGISPCNAEIPTDLLMNSWITPNEIWYVRNHHPVPQVDIKNFRLNIEQFDSPRNNAQFSYTVNELKEKFNSKSVISTMQCGGNRRGGLNSLDKTSGTAWNCGAISNAKWSGVSLLDVLNIDPVKDQELLKKYNHIIFESIDGMKASIPIEKGLNPFGDVILAYSMNDEDIPPDHGYPLRVIVPGYVGVRNVKWINKIILSEDEADGTWQKGLSYKGLAPYIKDAKDVDLNKVYPINEPPVQSFIVSQDKKNIKGIAWSGGGRNINRVDVSLDDGKTWNQAILNEGSEQPYGKAWAWTFWEYPLKCDANIDTIVCRAVDSSYNIQPEKIDSIWNIRGLNNNSWHRIVQNK